MANTDIPLTNDDLRTILSEVCGVELEGRYMCSYKAGDFLVLATLGKGAAFSYPESEEIAASILNKLGVYHPGIKSFELQPGEDIYPVIDLSMYLLNSASNNKQAIRDLF